MSTPEFIFASGNAGKLREARAIAGNVIEIVSMRDLGFTEDIPEDEKTFEGNSRAKARYIFERTSKSCFADDSGLEVDALGGLPGVYSARYAGEPVSSENNILKLLKEMRSMENRKANFRSVICLIINSKETLFEGVMHGKISSIPSGNQGFGYDPIFIPDGHETTLAEMSLEEKNKISHRAQAMNQMIQFLKEIK